jgi:hypothetical protein
MKLKTIVVYTSKVFHISHTGGGGRGRHLLYKGIYRRDVGVGRLFPFSNI